MRKIRVGLIGLGRFSKFHLSCLKQIPSVSLTAVCDAVADKVSDVTAEWGCNGYTDWRRMLEVESLDAVTVLTPEPLHAEPVMGSLEAGCHVFVEKPIALNTADATQMIQKSTDVGKILMVGHVCRFDARYIEIKRHISDGRLGKIRSVYARRNNRKMYFPIYRRTDPIFILGIHDIDLLQWFTDSHVTEVYAHRTASTGKDYDLVCAMLKFDNGSLGIIENNWLLPDSSPAFMDVCMEIVGQEGVVNFQEPDQALVFWGEDGVVSPPVSSGSDVYGRTVGPLFEELLHFYECVNADKPSTILRPEDALAAVRVAEAIVQSCQTGTPVHLSAPFIGKR